MATAGAGDALSGAIAALIAQGLAPYDAAVLGAYAHGLAGDLRAAKAGQLGLTAGDIIESLPAAFRVLSRGRDRPPQPFSIERRRLAR
jgi:NAD(P)H-hydrate epimerase